MKSPLALLGALVAVTAAGAQNTITYRLDGDFAADVPGAPALDSLGAGAFAADTLAEVDGLERTSYRFARGSGLAFDNGEAGDFLGASYTLELYFRLDDLASWRRIVDYDDRASDNGLYAKDGRINFFDATLSPEAPLAPGEYAHVVATRDSADGERYAIYVDGELAAAFADTVGDGLLGDGDPLAFFRDDLRVPGETSAGTVALVRLRDYALDSLGARAAFAELGASVASPPSGIGRAGGPDLSAAVRLSPNPVADVLRVELLDADLLARGPALTAVFRNVTGAVVLERPYAERLDLTALPPGLYALQLKAGAGALGSVGRLLVR